MKFISNNFLIVIAFLLGINCCAQNAIVDSLVQELEKFKSVPETFSSDTDKINTLVAICFNLKNAGEPGKAYEYGNQALLLSQKVKWNKGEAKALNNIGVIYMSQGNYPKALDLFFKALSIAEKIPDKKIISADYGNIGNVYLRREDYPKALDYYSKALSLATEMKNKKRMSNQYNNMGIVYYEQGRLAINLHDSIKADSLFNCSIDSYNKALELDEKSGSKNGVAADLGNIGLIYDQQKNYPRSIDFFLRALKLAQEIGDKQLEANNFGNLGSVYTEQKKYQLAEKYLLESLEIDSAINSLEGLKSEYLGLSNIYSLTGKDFLAFTFYKKYISASDSLVNEDNTRKQTQTEMQYEFDKKTSSDSIRNAEQNKQEVLKHNQEIQQQKIYTYGGAIGFTLMLVVAGVSFRAYRNKQKANKIISQQKFLVEEKQKEILDSIHYAKRIQEALLPTEKYIGKVLEQRK